jgi:hypothetical protein
VKIVIQYKGREEENKKVCFNSWAAFGLSRHLSSFFFSSFLLFQCSCQQDFSLDGVTQKKERRRLITNPLLPFFLLRF